MISRYQLSRSDGGYSMAVTVSTSLVCTKNFKQHIRNFTELIGNYKINLFRRIMTYLKMHPLATPKPLQPATPPQSQALPFPATLLPRRSPQCVPVVQGALAFRLD